MAATMPVLRLRPLLFVTPLLLPLTSSLVMSVWPVPLIILLAELLELLRFLITAMTNLLLPSVMMLSSLCALETW
jgi:hypothetical protein